MILACDKDVNIFFHSNRNYLSKINERKKKQHDKGGNKKNSLETYFSWERNLANHDLKIDDKKNINRDISKVNVPNVTCKDKSLKRPEATDKKLIFKNKEFQQNLVSKNSLLSHAIKNSEAAKMGLKLYISKTIANDGTVEIVEVFIDNDASVEEVIIVGLTAAKHRCYHASSYVLRLHDGNGIPDSDMPALDKKRKIKKFGESEYCISLIKLIEANDEKKNGIDDNYLKLASQGVRTLEIIVLKDRYTIRIETYHDCLADLISTLRRKRVKLPLYIEGIKFIISEEDRRRVGLPSCDLGLSCKLQALGSIRTIRLQKKRFADMGNDELEDDRFSNRKSLSKPHSLQRRGTSSRRSSSDGSQQQTKKTFIFNPLTAAEYKEWQVMKTNKWGMKQRRWLGLSLTKITNKKADSNRSENQPSRDVKRRERNISDVANVEIDGNSPCVFSITYKEGNTSLTYETEEPEDAAEIVAKIKYIQSLSSTS